MSGFGGNNTYHRDRGFKPINTLSSTELPSFRTATPHSVAAMVHEREPPRPAAQASQEPLYERTNIQPQFGTASPLRNPLQNKQRSIFNVPKPGQSRPEHHRTTPPVSDPVHTTAGRPAAWNPLYKRPIVLNTSSPDHSVVEIPRPTNPRPPSILPRQQAVFSSSRAAGFQPVNGFKLVQSPVDLTRHKGSDGDSSDEGFDVDKAVGDDKFGAFDPQNYMDAAQANENIKALLEGALEDDDEKPKTRARKKKQEAAAADLADKLQFLDIANKSDTTEQEQEGEDEDDGTVDGLTVKLLPHQIDGLTWMLDKEIGQRKKNGVLPKGGILADDMGLGKTIQALSLILSNPRPSADDLAKDMKRKIPEAAGKSTLVVAPLALIKQWESEIKSKVDTFPKMKVIVHHGATRTKRFEDLKKYDVVITTYQTLTSEHESSSEKDQGLKVGCFGVHWYRVILDEAHSIKNRNAKMTKAACALKSVYRWCLTGTPMQNNLDELQSLIHFLRIKPYNDLRTWKEQIIQPMKTGRGGLAMKRLQFFLKAFMKRRTKDVLKKEGGLNFGKNTQANGEAKARGFKIVGRDVETIVAEFNDAERQLYNRLEARTEKSLQDMMGSFKNDYIGALVLLLRLRQACNHPELIRGNLKKEKDSMSAGTQTVTGLQIPRKALSATQNVDDIADMFSALTVETKKCDVCQSKLDKAEIVAGAIRCADCETDLDSHRRSSRGPTGKPKSERKYWTTNRAAVAPPAITKRRNVKRVMDSDDEDDEGEWIVPKSQQLEENLGKAGGTDDEDAEGGGEWLGADASVTANETQISTEVHLARKRATSTPATDSFIEHDDSYAQENNDTDNENESNPSESETSTLVSSTKIRRLLQILREQIEDHKFIVFSEFTSMLDLVEPFLLRENFRFTRYDGSMRNDDREASLERLRNDPRTRILLCSLRCGSLGLNLTAASRVVILEPFWNPFVEEQAIDRVHRLNQTRDVTVYRLTIANSVEERILDLQAKKRELAKAAIEGGKAVGKLDMKDIMSLFRRDAEHDARYVDPVAGVGTVVGGVGGGGASTGLGSGGWALAQGKSMGLLEQRERSGLKTTASVAARQTGNIREKVREQSAESTRSGYGPGSGAGSGSGSGSGEKSEKPKFMVPPALKSQTQFGEAFQRRW